MYRIKKVLTYFLLNADVFSRPKSARAVDWIAFLLYVVPTLIYENLEQNGCNHLEPMARFISACAIALSWDISVYVEEDADDEISDIDRLQTYVQFYIHSKTNWSLPLCFIEIWKPGIFLC